MARQPTMADIARQAGVSRVAVSYALNGRPGVSDQMRGRILEIARDLGFSASLPARMLHGSAVARAVGLTMRRPADAFSVEVFRRELISGAHAELMAADMGLALQFVRDQDEELEVYRRWSAEGRVAGVLVCDPETDDKRPEFLRAQGLPALVIGGPVAGAACLFGDEATAAADAVHYLLTLGHTSITRVSGPHQMLHSVARNDAFTRACHEAGANATVVEADYTGEAGTKLTRRILSSRHRPTAILYDNDVMAVAALSVAQEMGLRVPQDLSIVAWEDSPLCQAVRPALTVLRRDIFALGAHAIRELILTIDGRHPQALLDHTAELIVRASTAPLHHS